MVMVTKAAEAREQPRVRYPGVEGFVERRDRDVVEWGGFTRFRRAAETPFNLVFGARP